MKNRINMVVVCILTHIICSCNHTDINHISVETSDFNSFERDMDYNMLIFPNNTCPYTSIVESYEKTFLAYKNGKNGAFVRSRIYYEEVLYNEQEFDLELSRLENYKFPYHLKTFKKDFSKVLFNFDTYIQYYIYKYNSVSSTYASIDYSRKTIYYISIKNSLYNDSYIEQSLIPFNIDLLPIDYYPSENNNRNYEYDILNLISDDNWPF